MPKTVTVPKEVLKAMGVAAPQAPTKKAAAAPAPAVKKGATGVKKSQASVQFVIRKAKKGAPLYAIAEQEDNGRPRAGKMLAAHTHAALTVLGMLEPSRPSVPSRAVLSLMGQRAMTWHTQADNFERDNNGGVRLTQDGHNKFKGRELDGKIDAAAANAFVSVFLDGKVDTKAIPVSPSAVYQISI